MPNNPAWLKCKNCLWFVFAGDEAGCIENGETDEDDWGCRIERGRSNGLSDRCRDWTCKRCFQPWNFWILAEEEILNHRYCMIQGRKKPEWVNYPSVNAGVSAQQRSRK